MSKIKHMTPTELCCCIYTCLAEDGIEVVLSGGACVAYYSEGKYVSMDFDFVNIKFAKRAALRQSMEKIGFREEGRHFVHPETDYVVEFPPGPLGVGDEQVKELIDVESQTGKMKMISATDCVKDRLAGFYHWDDRECLEQAIMVAQRNLIDLKEIEEWSKREGKASVFKVIEGRLK